MLAASHTLRRSSLRRVGRGFRRQRARAFSQSLSLSETTAETPLVAYECQSTTVRNKRPLYARGTPSTPSSFTTKFLPTLADFANGFGNKKPQAHLVAKASQEEKEEFLEALFHTAWNINVDAFAHVLSSMETHKQTGLARRAENWMKRLEMRLKEEAGHDAEEVFDHDSILPILQCHALVIQAWADTIGDDPMVAVNRAENWLEKAKSIAAKAPPTQIQSVLTHCYNAYLDACSKGRGNKAVGIKSSKILPQKAQDTFEAMLDQYQKLGAASSPVIPNTESVNFVMRAITQVKTETDVADKTGRLLKFMENSVANEQQSDNNTNIVIHPNPKSYCIWLYSLATLARLKAQNSSHKTQNSDGLAEIKGLEEALNHMVQLFQKGRLGVFENAIPHNTLLTAWAGISGKLNGVDAPMQAEKIFRAMIELSQKDIPEAAPDTTSYLQIIRAWARSGSDRAGEKASWWLNQQWSEYEERGDRENLMPTTRTYIAAISAWGNAGNADEAEDLFVDCLRRYENQKAPQLKPNTEIFTVVIRAWLQGAESKAVGQQRQIARLSRAVEWVDNMVTEESKGGPSTSHDIFLNVLKSAAWCAYDSTKVLDMSYRTFTNLRNSRHYVDPKAYAWLLEVALLALAKPEHDQARTAFVTKLVNACCEDGLVSRPLIHALTKSTTYHAGWTNFESARLTHELFPDYPLPPAWTRNLKRDTLQPRPQDFKRPIQRRR